MDLRKIKGFKLKGKKVLLRIDINAPVLSGKVLDAPRFKEASQTINELIKKKAKIILIAHQGRKGDRDFLSLKQNAKILSKYTSKRVKYVDDLFGKVAEKAISDLKNGEVILLKNVRAFNDEKDTKNKNNLYKNLCLNCDIFINDAFSVSHREQGSIILPPKYLPSGIGLNFEKELSALEKYLPGKNGSGVFLIGGQKIEDYLPIFNVLKNKSNIILASGVLANLFLITQEVNLGYEKKWMKKNNYIKLVPVLKKIMKKYPGQIILPIDFALGSPDIKKAKKRKEFLLEDAPFKDKIWDVGSRTIDHFKLYLSSADSIFMKGPLGYSEIPNFSNGTVEILKYISQLSQNKNVYSLLGGGHLTNTLQQYKIPNNFSHTSTSGGALIAFISGKKLPGLEAIKNSKLA